MSSAILVMQCYNYSFLSFLETQVKLPIVTVGGKEEAYYKTSLYSFTNSSVFLYNSVFASVQTEL